jgi:hypothetical protein
VSGFSRHWPERAGRQATSAAGFTSIRSSNGGYRHIGGGRIVRKWGGEKLEELSVSLRAFAALEANLDYGDQDPGQPFECCNLPSPSPESGDLGDGFRERTRHKDRLENAWWAYRPECAVASGSGFDERCKTGTAFGAQVPSRVEGF